MVNGKTFFMIVAVSTAAIVAVVEYFEGAKVSMPSSESMSTLSGLILLALILAIYFLPAIVALNRQHKNAIPILIVNLFLGWTLLGWVIALSWALTAQD
jgi:hypothetical protein